MPRVVPGPDLDERNDEVAGDEEGVLEEYEAPAPACDAGGEPDGDRGLPRAARREIPGASRGTGPALPGERAGVAAG
ncbi:MAG: hypothetical protein IPN03_12105 [Holophagales bacterium]|nr:hypothetical protein [Holophagales bacterium]MBK9374442.1 hypothetical protein [Holophagales bacterium]